MLNFKLILSTAFTTVRKKWNYYQRKKSQVVDTQYRSINYCDGVLNLKINSHAGELCFFRRSYEAHIQTLMKSCIPQGTNVLDIGANVGIHTIFMAQCVQGGGMVYAFEPVKHIRNDLYLNVKLAGRFSNSITIFPYAVGASNTKESMFVVKENEFDQGSSSIVENEYLSTEQMRSKTQRYDVDVVTIDDFIKLHSITNISFIKIDIEGCEYEALKGAQDLLKTEKPTLIIEYNIDRIRHIGLDHQHLRSVLNGYSCFEIVRDTSFNRDLYSLEPFLFDRDVKCDLLCLPF